MNDTDAEAPNAGQIDYWNGPVGNRWAALQARLDELFSGLTAAAIEAAAAKAGESALDVGCGCGATVLALAERVGPSGKVLGVDVSQPMLEIARLRMAEATLRQTELLPADAAVHPFAAASVDLIFSRFGVMFFDAPAHAFANMRRALRSDGRVLFVCWRAYKDNPFFSVPLDAARPHLPKLEEPMPPADAPGPFALADPDRLQTILREAGFGQVAIEPRDIPMRLAGPGDLASATDLVAQIGPFSRALAGASEAQRDAARKAVGSALAEFDGSEGVWMPARVWFVSARG